MQEQRRNRGFGRALLDSIEEIARFLEIPRLMLCSTDDSDTKVHYSSSCLGD
jgi:N-acetylglutamate synthase-like GNAT family acetyltransferase